MMSSGESEKGAWRRLAFSCGLGNVSCAKPSSLHRCIQTSCYAGLRSQAVCSAGQDCDVANMSRRRVMTFIASFPFAFLRLDVAKAEDDRRLEKAVEDFREVTGLQDLAFEYTNRNRFADADILWTKIISLNDRNPAAFSNRGNCRTSQGRFDEAISDFNRAIELAPEEPDPFLGKGVALERIGNFKDAIASYSQSNELSKKRYGSPDPVALNNIGNAYGGLGNWKSAYEFYKQASDLDTRFVFALANEALALYQLGDDDKAIKTMRFLARKYPGFGDMHAAIAMALWERGQRIDAEDEWYRATQNDTRYVPCMLHCRLPSDPQCRNIVLIWCICAFSVRRLNSRIWSSPRSLSEQV